MSPVSDRSPARQVSRARPSVASIELTEKQWQSQVTDLLRATGWIWLHVLNARATRKGAWRPPIAGPLATGYPDLTVFRRCVCGVIECKRQDGVLSPEQHEVLGKLQGQVTFVWVVRPADLQHLGGWLVDPLHAPRAWGWEF